MHMCLKTMIDHLKNLKLLYLFVLLLVIGLFVLILFFFLFFFFKFDSRPSPLFPEHRTFQTIYLNRYSPNFLHGPNFVIHNRKLATTKSEAHSLIIL